MTDLIRLLSCAGWSGLLLLTYALNVEFCLVSGLYICGKKQIVGDGKEKLGHFI